MNKKLKKVLVGSTLLVVVGIASQNSPANAGTGTIIDSFDRTGQLGVDTTNEALDSSYGQYIGIGVALALISGFLGYLTIKSR